MANGYFYKDRSYIDDLYISLDLSEEGEIKRNLARERGKIWDERLGTQIVSLEFSSIMNFEKDKEIDDQSLKKNPAASAA